MLHIVAPNPSSFHFFCLDEFLGTFFSLALPNAWAEEREAHVNQKRGLDVIYSIALSQSKELCAERQTFGSELVVPNKTGGAPNATRYHKTNSKHTYIIVHPVSCD